MVVLKAKVKVMRVVSTIIVIRPLIIIVDIATKIDILSFQDTTIIADQNEDLRVFDYLIKLSSIY